MIWLLLALTVLNTTLLFSVAAIVSSLDGRLNVTQGQLERLEQRP